MLKIFITVFLLLLIISGCKSESNIEIESYESIKYNIIEPGNGIYVITKKNVEKEKTKSNYFEAVYYTGNQITKIERYNTNDLLTDSLSVAATTIFEYSSNGKVKFLRYFDKDGNNAEDYVFGFSSVEYIYDEQKRVRMEIYRDAESKFLSVPRDNSGNIAKVNFLSPILTYEYIGDSLKIKALDHNFNLLKEVVGDKPCVPFIDCGESD